MAFPSPPETEPLSASSVVDPVVRTGTDDGLDLRELIDLLLRGKWIILGTAALLAIPVAIYQSTLPSIYQSTATLLIEKDRAALQGVPGSSEFFQGGHRPRQRDPNPAPLDPAGDRGWRAPAPDEGGAGHRPAARHRSPRA